MTIIRLKYFLAVAIGGSFSEAAEILYTTQSSVSKQIIALEKELSTELFDRSHRKILLTEQGKIVLRHSQVLIDNYNAMMGELTQFGLNCGSTLVVASIPVMAHYGIPSIIGIFQKAHPEISLVLEECEGCDILPAMEQRQYEMAFMRSDHLDMQVFDRLELFSDNVVVVASENHAIATAGALSLSDLKGERFLLQGKSTLIYQLCVKACNERGFQPNIIYTGTRSENIIEMVSNGMGISLMMKQSAQYANIKGVTIIPLTDNISSTISLVRVKRGHYTKAAKVLWDFIKMQTEERDLMLSCKL